MRSKQSLQKLLNLTRHQEQVRTTKLSEKLAEQRASNDRLLQLKHYISEYQNGKTPKYLPSVENRRKFTLQLSEAIIQQKNKNKEIEAQLKPSYQSWMLAKQRREAVENAMDESLREIEEKQEQARQKDLEAYAARNMRRKLDTDF